MQRNQDFRAILTYTECEYRKENTNVFVWYDQGVAGGVLRGAGKQLVGALCNLVGFYFIGVPIGVSLMFAANMGIVGKNKPLMYSSAISTICSPISCLSTNVPESH